MRTANPMVGAGLPHMGPVTRWLLGIFTVVTVAGWSSRTLSAYGVFDARDVLSGEAWRLLSYAGFSPHPLNLLFGLFVVVAFGAQLETGWGSKTYLKRVIALIIVPALLVLPLPLVFESLRAAPGAGFDVLATAVIVAYASRLRSQQIVMFPIPFAVSGDGLIYFEGGMLLLYAIFHHAERGLYVQLLLPILAFAYAVAWFRLGWFKGVRRLWLRLRQRQVEARMAKLRASHNIRVVPSDDDEPRRFLH
jgi:hypothetical protein